MVSAAAMSLRALRSPGRHPTLRGGSGRPEAHSKAPPGRPRTGVPQHVFHLGDTGEDSFAFCSRHRPRDRLTACRESSRSRVLRQSARDVWTAWPPTRFVVRRSQRWRGDSD
jgi:hypothetical protein